MLSSKYTLLESRAAHRPGDFSPELATIFASLRAGSPVTRMLERNLYERITPHDRSYR
jgi:hypothetical protein